MFIVGLKIAVLALFIYGIAFGILYPTKEENIFTTALFWSLFWSLFVVVTLSTLGRVFCGICPHGFMGKHITRYGLKKKMPKALANPYIGIFLLLIGFWAVYYIYPEFVPFELVVTPSSLMLPLLNCSDNFGTRRSTKH
jgi:polyferredoxin